MIVRLGGVEGTFVLPDEVPGRLLFVSAGSGITPIMSMLRSVPLAIVDATEITERGTRALTALGAKYLARRDTRILGHVGACGTAFSNVAMLDNLFDFEESA